ncbi:MAG: metal-binding protein [Thermosynechococcaceae cyanobacterium]
MPSGRTHDQITLRCLPWLGGASLLVTFNLGLTAYLCGGFLFSGFMFGPDLDIYSKQSQRWGVLRFIWIPYRKALSHRSWLSHGPIVGTVLRLLYLGGWIGLVLALLQWVSRGRVPWSLSEAVQVIEQLWQRHPRSCVALLLGLEIGAMSHSLSDVVGSRAKAVLKCFKQKVKRRPRQRR